MKRRSLLLLPLLALFAAESRSAPLTLAGAAGNLLVSGSGATAVTGGAFANGDTISYTGTPAAAFTVSVTGDIVPGAISLANTASTITFGGTNTVTGTSYTKTGTGAVYFNTGMSFSGGISTGSGFIATGAGSTGNGLVTQTGTLASLELFSLTSDSYNLSGGITLTNTANANVLAFGGLGSGVNATKTLSNNITLSSNAVQSRFVILGDANTNTAQAGKHDVVLSGKISGGVTGATFFINTDQGTTGASSLKLTNATNDFVANINVNRGGLAITSDAALGNSANNVTIDSNNTNGGLRFDAALTSARTFTFTVNEAVDTNGNDVTLSGIVAGAGTITKKSAGALTLSGTSANTFTGNLIVGAGTVKLGKASALGTTAGGTSITSGAVLDLNGQTIGAEAVTLNGTGISSGGSLVNSSATAASLSGAITLGSNASVGGNNATTLSGVVSGAFTLTKVGTGTLTLSNGSNTHASTTLNAGTLSLGSVTALGTGQLTHAGGTLQTTALTSNATIANAIALSGTGDRILLMHGIGNGSNTIEYSGQITGSATRLYLNNNQGASTNPQFILSNATNSFTANVLINRGGLRITSNGALGNLANTVTFDSNNGADLTFVNAMTYTRATTLSTDTDFDTGANAVTASGVISGGAAFTKIGSGNLTLTATNTYTGATTVSAGTLQVNGSLANTTTTVNGGTLAGTGSIAGSVTIGTATLAAGASPGSLELGANLSLGTNTTTAIELGGTNFTLNGVEDYDRIKLTNNSAVLTLNGTLSLALVNSFSLARDQAFGIFQLESGATRTGTFTGLGTDGSLVGNFGGLDLFITYSGNFGDSGTVSTFGGNDVVLYTVPEPGAALLGGLGLLALIRRRR
jgi:autotransporter-associated beta strand protein